MHSGGGWLVHGGSVPGDKLGCNGVGVPSRERKSKLLFVETSRGACSYRGELCGLLAIHLILWVVNEINPEMKVGPHILGLSLGAGQDQQPSVDKNTHELGTLIYPQDYHAQL